MILDDLSMAQVEMALGLWNDSHPHSHEAQVASAKTPICGHRHDGDDEETETEG